MKNISLGNTEIKASQIALGCMRLASLNYKEADAVINTAMDNGINFFDHADIYGGGRSEEIFGEILKNEKSLRNKIYIQSKCGIRSGYFDSSYEHIVTSCEGSLKRLNTDYLDVLLIHRPDALCEPSEIARAFEKLHSEGKVRYFGVSNHNSMQVELLQKYLRMPLIVNQLQLSVVHTGMIDEGICVNMKNQQSVMHDGSVLNYSRLNSMTVQAWSPLQYGMIEGSFMDNSNYEAINAELEKMAKEKGVEKNGLSIAWILRHPANIQAIIGCMNTTHIEQICRASDLEFTRPEWYSIYRAAGNIIP